MHKLTFDTNKDFKPISLLAKVLRMYVVNADVPAKNLKEFIALAKSKPGRLNYGSAGNGSAGHLAFEYLRMVSDMFVLHVPYRGTGPQLTDLLAGRLLNSSDEVSPTPRSLRELHEVESLFSRIVADLRRFRRRRPIDFSYRDFELTADVKVFLGQD